MTEVETFSVQTHGDDNPYTWDVDLTMVTLANFNYRTLSLVRDYDALLAEPRPNAAFEELFSTAPRDVAQHGATVPVADRYLVVPADASQVGAVALARSGDNFVIQGPPGTGKSQTITNLVADAVAHGRRVLFVCQKRAALDVVHARLRAQGLGEICTLVHDSQEDKKEFVHGLRDTYERWLADDEPLADVEARRTALVDATTAALAEVGEYERALAGVQDVLDRLIALRAHRWGDELTPAEQALLPEPADWVPARPSVDALVGALARAGAEPVLARTPVRLVDPTVLDEARADAVVAQRAQEAVQAIDAVLAVLGAAGATADGDGLTVDDADAVGAAARGAGAPGRAGPRLRGHPAHAGRAPARAGHRGVARGRGGRGGGGPGRGGLAPAAVRTGRRGGARDRPAARAVRVEVPRRRVAPRVPAGRGRLRRGRPAGPSDGDAGPRAARRAIRRRRPRRRALPGGGARVGSRGPGGAQRADRGGTDVHGRAGRVAWPPGRPGAGRRAGPAPRAGRGRARPAWRASSRGPTTCRWPRCATSCAA